MQAYEVDKKVRFERAKKEREAAEAKRQEADRKLEEAKAKANDKAKAKAEEKEAEPTDDLMGFFSEVGVVKAAKPKPEKVLNDSYAKADLGERGPLRGPHTSLVLMVSWWVLCWQAPRSSRSTGCCRSTTSGRT